MSCAGQYSKRVAYFRAKVKWYLSNSTDLRNAQNPAKLVLTILDYSVLRNAQFPILNIIGQYSNNINNIGCAGLVLFFHNNKGCFFFFVGL